MVPAKDEEVGLKYLIDDFESSGIKEDYDITLIFVIDERTSDNSRLFASRLSDHIIDQCGSHGKGDAIKKQLAIWKILKHVLSYSWMQMALTHSTQ